MRVLIGTLVAVVAALFSSCAGPAVACDDGTGTVLTLEEIFLNGLKK